MFEYINLLLIFRILAWIGIGILIDSLMKKDQKEKISDYIFGTNDVGANEFESGVVTGLIGTLCNKNNIDKLSFSKIAIYILSISIGQYLLFGSSVFDGENMLLNVQNFAILILVLFIFSAPFVAFSIYVTKRIFYDKYSSSAKFLILIIVDIIISISPIILFLYFIADINNDGETTDIDIGLPFFLNSLNTYLALGIITIFVGSFLLNILQLIAWVSGNFIRLIGKPFANSRIDLEKIRKFPFTIMFLVFAILISTIELIVSLIQPIAAS